MNLIDKILERWPSSDLLRLIAAQVLGNASLELPGGNAEPIIVADRLISLANVLGRSEQLEILLSQEGQSLELKKIPRHHYLPTRTEFFDEACTQLAKSSSMRVTFVGPVFLHPEWVYQKRHEIDRGPSFGQNVAAAILNRKNDSGGQYRFILRNQNRYIKRLSEYLSNNEKSQLVDELIYRIDSVWGSKGAHGPEIRCIDVGYGHLPHVFDDAVLFAARRSSTTGVEGGWCIENKLDIARERSRFDQLFEGAQQSQRDAIKLLNDFVMQFKD